MANEIGYSLSLNFSKSGLTTSVSSGTVNVTVNGSKFIRNVQTLSTSDEALDVGEISTLGMTLLHNLDSTNNVLVSTDNGVTFGIKLLPGEWAVARPNAGTTLKAKSSAGTPNLEYFISED